MAIGVIWYPPIDQQTYNAIKEKVWGAAIDKGMKIHAGEKHREPGVSLRSGNHVRLWSASFAKTCIRRHTK